MRRLLPLLLLALAAACGPVVTTSYPATPDSPAVAPSGPSAGTSAVGLPPASTPGAVNLAVTQANIHQTICVSGWTATVRPPASYTTALKRQQMADEGLPGSTSLYEEDHRVPLEVGGAPHDPTNLWPELWDGPMGAHAKDLIENRVRADVCVGRLTLAQGQAVFLGDWWTANV